jgi:DNA repair exonuclease SbcCD nuclease subunit
MKIASISDLHLNRLTYKGVMDREFTSLPFRNADFMRSFAWMVDDIINNEKPDLVTLCGDIYDYFDPNNEVRGFFSAQCKKLVVAKIPMIILIGNHDVCRKHHALKDISELGIKSIKVVDQSEEYIFKDHNLLLFPYSLDVECQKITVIDSYNQFIEKVNNGPNKDMPRLMFMHAGIRGGKINEYTDTKALETLGDISKMLDINLPKKEFRNSSKSDLDNDDLDKANASYVFLGDYHERQVLNTKKCVAIYSGSIEKTDIKETNQTKGYVVYDSEGPINDDTKMGKCRFVDYPNCRPMIELKGTLLEIKEQFDKANHSKLKDAIVKINFVGNQSELIDFSVGLDALKKDINNKITPIHMFHEQNTRNEEQETKATELQNEIESSGHITNDDVLKIISEIITEQIKEKDEMNAVIMLAKEIFDEVKK